MEAKFSFSRLQQSLCPSCFGNVNSLLHRTHQDWQWPAVRFVRSGDGLAFAGENSCRSAPIHISRRSLSAVDVEDGLPMAHFGEGRRSDVQLTNSLRQIIRQPTSTLTAASITLFLKKHSGFLLCLITMLQLGRHQPLQDYLPIIQSPESHGIRVRCRIEQSGLHALSTKKGSVIK